MARTSFTTTLLLLAALLVLSACGSETTNDTPDEGVEPEGGEELLSVRADYAYCYDTGSYDPTQRYRCEMELSYDGCKEWMGKQEGTGKTHFYAEFSGGEPTQAARTANEYYMVVKYGDGLVETTDTSAVFKDFPSEFVSYVDGGCYPNATIEIYNTEDELMGRESFDYSG